MKLGCYGKLCGGTSPQSVICGSASVLMAFVGILGVKAACYFGLLVILTLF